MQKTRTMIPVYLSFLPVVASCVLRFFQLTRYTDSETGFVTGNNGLTPCIYGLLFLSLVFLGIYSVKNKSSGVAVDFENCGKAQQICSLILSVSFFFDFIRQCYNCCDTLQRYAYVEYAYLIPLALSGVAALFSSFYFISFYLTVSGSGYDFRNLTWFHFAPAVWGFLRLILIMIKIVDVRLDVETVLEFLLLAFLLMLFFCYIFMIDNGGKSSAVLIFSAFGSFASAFLLVVPRLSAMLFGMGDRLSRVDYSAVNYIAVGIFALALAVNSVKNKKIFD